MGQIETSVQRILDALRLLNSSTQHLSTYEFTYSFGTAEVTEVTAIAGALAALKITTELIGTIGATTSFSGSMFVSQLAGTIDVAGITAAELKIITEMISSIAAESTASGSIMGIGVPVLVAGASIGASGTVASLLVDTELIGSSTGEASGVAARLWA